MVKIEGSAAVVTGASSGIGRAIALELARRGASLAIAARREQKLAEVSAECRALGARCEVIVADVRRPEDCERLITTSQQLLGPIDLLVNNAGYAIFDAIEHSRLEDLEGMMATNYFGAVQCTRLVLPSMLERRHGAIVSVGSIAGILGFFRMGGYCASKFALAGFMESLRDEVIDRNVSVSLVCPGTTNTEFFTTAERGKMPAASRLILAIPPERVARAVIRAAERGSYRIILPWTAAIYMKFKELFPRAAHFLMRNTSRAIEKGRR